MQTFSKKEAISYGWETFKTRWPFFVGLIVFLFVVDMLFGIASSTLEDQAIPFAFAELLRSLISWILALGLVDIMLRTYDKRETEFYDLFKRTDVFFNYILASILYGLIILGGLILLIVPGIIWAIKYQFYIYSITDKGLGPWESLKESGKITNGHKWNLFVFMILIALINFGGVLALGLGLLVTIPLSALATTWVYRWLEFNSKALGAPAETDLAPTENTSEETSL